MPKTSYLEQMLGENKEALLAIREVPFFHSCSQELLALVYRYGKVFSLGEGDVLARENEFDQWVYFLLSGRLAVTMGNERVDTISSSLVGEQCLLGVARHATLSATEEGMVALGVDMALMDSLSEQDEHQQAVMLELLSIITGEIVSRIAYLSRHQIDISSRFSMIQEADRQSALIDLINSSEFASKPRVNMEIYKFLQQNDRGLLAQSVARDGITVDTVRLYAQCVNTGRYEVVLGLSAHLHRFFQMEQARMGANRGQSDEPSGTFQYNFSDFSRCARKAVNQALPQEKAISETFWAQQFRVNEELSVDLVTLGRWLRSSYGLTGRQTADALMAILQEASDYTAKINTSIKAMVREMSATALISNLEKMTANPESQILESMNTRTPEEMIPMFSKHILQVHLVNPFLEALGGQPGVELDAAGVVPDQEAEGGGQNIADTLFD